MDTKGPFTAMSGEGMLAMVVASRRNMARGEKFAMELNPADFEGMVNSLADVAQQRDDEVGEWARDMLGTMAESLGVEWV